MGKGELEVNRLLLVFIIMATWMVVGCESVKQAGCFGHWVEHNTKYSNLWPNITKKRAEDVPQDQEKWRGVPDKFKYFSEKSGKGD